MRSLLVLLTIALSAFVLVAAEPPQTLVVLQAVKDQPGSTMTLDDLQVQQHRQQAEPPPIFVQPAAAPEPALRLRLYPAKWELRPGSALLHFSRAQTLLAQHGRAVLNQWQSEGWLEGTGDGEIPTDEELNDAVDALQPVYDELHKLAMSEEFSWDHRLRDLRGPDVYLYLLPDVQEARTLARMLALRIRAQLQRRDIEGAIQSISDGLRLAEFVGQGESLIQKLVGIAIQSMMRERITRVIATPGSPNLYWALATIPRPLNEIRDSVLWELNHVSSVLPALAEAETAVWTQEVASAKWSGLLQDLQSLSGSSFDDDLQIALAIGGVTFVAEAKARLTENGFPEERLAKLPGLQILLLDAHRELRRLGDDLGKGYLLPAPMSEDVIHEAQDRFENYCRQNRLSSLPAVIARTFFPAVRQARRADLRTRMTFNRLSTLEALRMHVATAGQLPASLDELKPVPSMPDPFTGKHFLYSVQAVDGGHEVTLEASGPAEHPWKQLTAVFQKTP